MARNKQNCYRQIKSWFRLLHTDRQTFNKYCDHCTLSILHWIPDKRCTVLLFQLTSGGPGVFVLSPVAHKSPYRIYHRLWWFPDSLFSLWSQDIWKAPIINCSLILQLEWDVWSGYTCQGLEIKEILNCDFRSEDIPGQVLCRRLDWRERGKDEKIVVRFKFKSWKDVAKPCQRIQLIFLNP